MVHGRSFCFFSDTIPRAIATIRIPNAAFAPLKIAGGTLGMRILAQSTITGAAVAAERPAMFFLNRVARSRRAATARRGRFLSSERVLESFIREHHNLPSGNALSLRMQAPRLAGPVHHTGFVVGFAENGTTVAAIWHLKTTKRPTLYISLVGRFSAFHGVRTSFR